MEAEKRKISFGISGEYITDVAREWMCIEGKDIEKITSMLMDSMGGTDTPKATLRRYAEDILLGRAALKGNTSDGTYHLEIYEPEEQEQMPENMDIWKVLAKSIQEQKRIQEELDKMVERYSTVMEHIPSYMQKEIEWILGESGDEVPPVSGMSSMLDSYIKRMTDEKEHSTEDYGWLEPDGTFHEVDWGQHQGWAEKYIRENMTEEEWLAAGVHMPGQMKTASCNTFGDYLVSRGWVLLDNPAAGIAKPTKDESKPYTKAQKEFLYDYYRERGCRTEANAIWKED